MNAEKKKYKSYKYRILIIGLLFVISILSYEYLIKQIKTEVVHQENSLKDRDFDIIWDFLNSCIAVSNTDAQELAKKIETNIKDQFNLTDLEKDLDEGNREELVDLVDNTIDSFVTSSPVKNNRNSCIVLESYDTIISDRMVDLSKVDTSKRHTTFSDYEETAYNKKLFATAERQLKNHTSTTPIAVEIYDYEENPKHILINSCTYEKLRNVYKIEGINGLRNYQFLVPAYITRDGDIFGNLDLKEGNPNDNAHKFVVIITFNLYDQLIQMRPDIDDEAYYEQTAYAYESILSTVYLVASVTCIVFFIICIFYAKGYNDAIVDYLGRKALEEENDDEEEE